MLNELQSKLLSVRAAASALGVQYRQILEAVNTGKIPHYRLQKSRRYVRLDEVLTIMKQQAEGEVRHD